MGATAREEVQEAGDVGEEDAGVTRTTKRPEGETEKSEIVLAMEGGGDGNDAAGVGAEGGERKKHRLEREKRRGKKRRHEWA